MENVRINTETADCIASSEPQLSIQPANLELAKDPALLYHIKLELDKTVYRETANKLLLFLICLSAITSRPLSAVIMSESAGGKSNLLHSVIAYFAKNVEYFTRVTTASIDRLATNLTGRILVIEELRGADAAQGTIRVAMSEGKLRLLTTDRDDHGKIITREIETKGTPVFLTTTTSTIIDWEMQTRLFIASLDESLEQTRGVMEYEAKEYDDIRPRQTMNTNLTELLTTLLPYDTLIPYAQQLAKSFPCERLSARRDFKKLLNLISVITFLHQQQRIHVKKRNQLIEHRLVATPIDLQYAVMIGGPSLRQNLAGVPSRVLSLLDHFKQGEPQTTKSIATSARISQRTARRWLGEDLIQAGYLTVDETSKEHIYFLADRENNPTLEIPEEVTYWDAKETRLWLKRQDFEIIQDVPDVIFVNPFTGDAQL